MGYVQCAAGNVPHRIVGASRLIVHDNYYLISLGGELDTFFPTELSGSLPNCH